MGKLLLGWMTGVTIATAPLIAAETTDLGPVNIDGLLMPLSNLCGMGFVIWFARHMVVSTVPTMQSRFDESIRDAFAEAKKARDEFHAELVALAEAHQRCAAEHRAAIDKLTDAIMQMVKQCSSRQRQTGTDSTERSIG